MNRMTTSTVRLEILSRPELLASVRAMVISLSERFGFDQIESGHLALAVDEALANVIRHGYEGDADGRIWIAIGIVCIDVVHYILRHGIVKYSLLGPIIGFFTSLHVHT